MASILFFAQAREVIGHEKLEWPLERPQRAEDLWAWLAAIHPAARTLQSYCRIACNGEYLLPEAEVLPADEVAIIPPVSGG